MPMTMSFPVLRSCEATPEGFVEFWDRHYSGYDEVFYRENIDKPLTDERIEKWFVWKNGTPLAPAKAPSIRR